METSFRLFNMQMKGQIVSDGKHLCDKNNFTEHEIDTMWRDSYHHYNWTNFPFLKHSSNFNLQSSDENKIQGVLKEHRQNKRSDSAFMMLSAESGYGTYSRIPHKNRNAKYLKSK
ncbi:hypothetical protein NPIL_155021 [Nephila pilipes]|uniref:Uncharacterized protein n=1 Tax=Nephila pilipes TaxID=299642 RepID=A0A8X6UKM1_NEPPI|nr:hypothetical protein NPIL_155021 [Nephila pilipes]